MSCPHVLWGRWRGERSNNPSRRRPASVPVLIPLAWFVLVYASYGLANLIADRLPGGIAVGRRPLTGLVLLGALVITALDLVVDPILSGPGFRAWVWDTAGP